ncbi:hypothetical protein [Luteitalea pratensis]|uniref:hypothetical protein n=1 Tax=Luteitalea pratensis TaxID=1855912 RepID=UPI000D7369FF|nr:hypothetical protein [Luteitalea pratensis]
MNAPITIDALLSAVEPVLGQSGRIVTALRINGVDEPAFRERDILERSLVGVDEIDLDTTPVGLMALQALDDALRFLPVLAGEARVVASGLRGAHVDEPRKAIGELADNLALMAALVHTADLWARQVGLAGGDWLGEDVAAVDRVAGAIEGAVGAEDWVTAADALEYDLSSSLEAWQARLVEGRGQVQALLSALPVPVA